MFLQNYSIFISYIANSLKLKKSPNNILKNHPKSETHFHYNDFNSIVIIDTLIVYYYPHDIYIIKCKLFYFYV